MSKEGDLGLFTGLGKTAKRKNCYKHREEREKNKYSDEREHEERKRKLREA